MAKKGGNSKAEAAKEKKSAVKNEKDRAAKAKEEEASAEKWSQGAKKNNKKESEVEKKVRRSIVDARKEQMIPLNMLVTWMTLSLAVMTLLYLYRWYSSCLFIT